MGLLWYEYGAIVKLVCAFVVGAVAGVLPPMSDGVVRTVALLDDSRGRRVATFGSFVLGVVVFFAPIGFVAGVSGDIAAHASYTTPGAFILAGAALVFAGSMFGVFHLALPEPLRAKLGAVGGRGLRGAFVLGLVVALVGAPI